MVRKFRELFHIRFTVTNIIMLAIACALNIAFILLSYFLHLPFVIDIAGTAYIAFMLGPTAGVIVSIITAFTQFVFYNLSAFIYVFVGIAVSLFIGICSRLRVFKDFLSALGIVFLCYAVNVLVSSVIPIIVGARECDVWIYYFVNIFRNAGMTPYASSILACTIMKLPDTLVAMGAVLVGYYVTPKKVRDEVLEIKIDED